MSDLNKEYRKIIKEIEGKLQDKKELEFVKGKMAELSLLFVDVIDRVTDLADTRLDKVEHSQKEMEKKLERLYAEEGFDFEIVCPYCNHEFVADIDLENKKDIECPECHNLIELDFSGEEGCGGECSGCHEHCNEKEDEDM